MTEAPISITFKVLYKGIEILVTKRDLEAKIKPFLEDTKKAIDWSLDTGNFQAPPLRGSGYVKKEKVYVEGRTCPKCGSKLIEATTKTGKKMIKCETNTWNAVTKQAEGCDFIEWGSDTLKPKIEIKKEVSDEDINDLPF